MYTSKITKSKQLELERGWRERNVRLKEIHLPKETFEQYMEWVYGRGKKEKQGTTNSKYGSNSAGGQVDTFNYTLAKGSREDTIKNKVASLHSWVTGTCSSKPSQTYTGSNMIGISQMSKSNAVPVFSSEEIINIAKMRR
jgi:hypothetical protein